MPGKTALPTGWQAILENPAGPLIYYKVVIDPDGLNVVCDGSMGVINIDPIEKSVEIEPDYWGKVKINDMSVTITDDNEFFRMLSARENSGFRGVRRVLSEDLSGLTMNFESGFGQFYAGDILVIADGENKESFKCTEATADSVTFDTGDVTNSYLAGATVVSYPTINLPVEIWQYITGNANGLLLFKGKITDDFVWNGSSASFRASNQLNDLLNQKLRVDSSADNPDMLANLNGELLSSFSWNSGHTTELSGVTVYDGATPGDWTVTMGTDGNFSIVGPGVEKSGNTSSDFYSGTDSSDSQILIESSSWSGVKTGDVLNFKVSVNFQNKCVPEIIYELLTRAGVVMDVSAGGVDDATTDNSFNIAYNLLDEDVFSFSFSTDISILEAVISILPHSFCLIGQGNEGKIKMVVLHADFYFEEVEPTIVGDPVPSRGPVFNEISIDYQWNTFSQEFEKNKIYPSVNVSEQILGYKKTVNLKLPGVRT